MSRTTARSAAMQMIFEKVSGGQGGEETLKMVYDELRETASPESGQSAKKNRTRKTALLFPKLFTV